MNDRGSQGEEQAHSRGGGKDFFADYDAKKLKACGFAARMGGDED